MVWQKLKIDLQWQLHIQQYPTECRSEYSANSADPQCPADTCRTDFIRIIKGYICIRYDLCTCCRTSCNGNQYIQHDHAWLEAQHREGNESYDQESNQNPLGTISVCKLPSNDRPKTAPRFNTTKKVRLEPNSYPAPPMIFGSHVLKPYITNKHMKNAIQNMRVLKVLPFLNNCLSGFPFISLLSCSWRTMIINGVLSVYLHLIQNAHQFAFLIFCHEINYWLRQQLI